MDLKFIDLQDYNLYTHKCCFTINQDYVWKIANP